MAYKMSTVVIYLCLLLHGQCYRQEDELEKLILEVDKTNGAADKIALLESSVTEDDIALASGQKAATNLNNRNASAFPHQPITSKPFRV